MASQNIEKLNEAHRLLLEQAGLGQAMALFPSDVLVAVNTSIQVRESFASLPRLEIGSAQASTETDSQ